MQHPKDKSLEAQPSTLEVVTSMSKVIRVRYEKGVLRPLEPLDLREGEEVKIRIERSIREELKDLIGVLGESSEEELERYLEEAWQQ